MKEVSKKICESATTFLKNCGAIWEKFGKFIFFGIAFLISFVLCVTLPFNWEISLAAAIASTVTFFCLANANIEIKDVFVRLGWCLLNFSLFVYLASTMVFYKDEFPMYFGGMLISTFVCPVLYSYIPSISFYLKLNSEKYGHCFFSLNKTSGNGVLGQFAMYTVIFLILSFYESNQHDEYVFNKIDYVKIDKWEKEIIDGQTCYVIMFSGKTIAISPLKYPEVRNINKNTKIKPLSNGMINMQGFLEVKMLDIKNY